MEINLWFSFITMTFFSITFSRYLIEFQSSAARNVHYISLAYFSTHVCSVNMNFSLTYRQRLIKYGKGLFQRFSNDYRQTNTKLNTSTNHKSCKKRDEPTNQNVQKLSVICSKCGKTRAYEKWHWLWVSLVASSYNRVITFDSRMITALSFFFFLLTLEIEEFYKSESNIINSGG